MTPAYKKKEMVFFSFSYLLHDFKRAVPAECNNGQKFTKKKKKKASLSSVLRILSTQMLPPKIYNCLKETTFQLVLADWNFITAV